MTGASVSDCLRWLWKPCIEVLVVSVPNIGLWFACVYRDDEREQPSLERSGNVKRRALPCVRDDIALCGHSPRARRPHDDDDDDDAPCAWCTERWAGGGRGGNCPTRLSFPVMARACTSRPRHSPPAVVTNTQPNPPTPHALPASAEHACVASCATCQGPEIPIQPAIHLGVRSIHAAGRSTTSCAPSRVTSSCKYKAPPPAPP
jgi:hypothetical protein